MNAKLVSPTPIGPVAILWSYAGNHPRVRHVLLPRGGLSARQLARRAHPAVVVATCAAIDAFARAVAARAGGKPARYSPKMLALASGTPFQQAVWRATARIPHGQVRTYGEIAAAIGKSGGARAVGGALGANPFPLAIPCHRVIRAGRQLGGFGGGAALKRALLAREGVSFATADRVQGRKARAR